MSAGESRTTLLGELLTAAIELSDAIHTAESAGKIPLPDYLDRAWEDLSLAIERAMAKRTACCGEWDTLAERCHDCPVVGDPLVTESEIASTPSSETRPKIGTTASSGDAASVWIALRGMLDFVYEPEGKGARKCRYCDVTTKHDENSKHRIGCPVHIAEGMRRIDPEVPTGSPSAAASVVACTYPQCDSKLGEQCRPECDPAIQQRAGASTASHDWQPDGGVLRFEVHPGGEAAHVHTTCAKCGARAWFLEYQWALLAEGCKLNRSATASLDAKDAARYRWLQQQPCHQDGTPMSESCYLDLNPRDMDAAIDSALEAADSSSNKA